MKKIAIIIFLFLSVYSCTKKEKVVGEGVLEYNIEYLTNKKDNPIVNLLPPSMYVKFKKNSTFTMIKGWMGIFTLSYISNFNDKKNTTLLKMMNQKYYYSSQFGDTNFVFDDYKGMKLKFTNDTKKILGYNCKKVLVTFPNSNKSPFEIYYTNEIKIKNSTYNTPFRDIDGVLMEFKIKMNGIPMHLIISKVKADKIPDNVFNVPPTYLKVEKSKIQNILDSLI